MLKITKVGRVMIRVSDQDEAIEFYTTSAALPSPPQVRP
jgi:catechol 2,3-dioxygenase-like lactoylglutathione lyase family enzyme